MIKETVPFKLILFGGFQLLNDKDEPINLTARKSKALLAWLAVNADHEHPRERLAGLFWPDSDDQQARHSLRQALSALRKVMPNTEGPLQTTKDWVRLDSRQITIDALVFNQVAAKEDETSLDLASELYKGEFLEGCNPHTDMFDDWLSGYRSDYSERAAAIINQRMLQLIDQEDFEQVIPLAMHLISIDPLQEVAYRALMQVHHELGNFAVALRWYRRCQRVLMIELGIQPDDETVALYKKLIATRNEQPIGLSTTTDSLLTTSATLRSQQVTNSKLSFNSEQRIIYQAEAAIEGILDQIGGQAFLIRGETGSGKARLAREIADLAESQGFFICYGRIQCNNLENANKSALEFTYKLSCCLDNKIHDRDAQGKDCDSADIETDGHKYTDISELIKTASEILPVLLLIEDLHNADTEILGLVAQLISAVGNSAALLVITSGFEGQPLDPIWRGAMRGAPLTTIDLESSSCQLDD